MGGAAAGVPDFIAVVVSTGVGGGIVLDGRLLDGAGGNAGHIGHVVVEPEGAACGCGARGCLEAEASGSAIAAVTGRPAAEAGPEVVARTGRLVGRAVASVANLLDLRLAVVAGSVALGFGEPFFAAAQAELDARARLSSPGARLVPAGLGPPAPGGRGRGGVAGARTPVAGECPDPAGAWAWLPAALAVVVRPGLWRVAVRQACGWPAPVVAAVAARAPSPTPGTCAFGCRPPTATPTGRRRPATWWPTWNGAAVSAACAASTPMGLPPATGGAGPTEA